MSGTFACPNCGAEYGYDQVPAGTSFTCGACDATVVAPKPVPAPARPRKGPAPRSAGAGRRAAAPRAPAKKSNAPLFIGLGVLAVVAAVVAFMMSDSSGDESTGVGNGEKQTAKVDPTIEAQEKVDAIKGKYSLTTAAGAWDASNALTTVAKEWRAAGKSERATRLISGAAAEVKKNILTLDPDFAPMREERGERKYANELEPFVDADYILDTDRNYAKKAHEAIVRTTKDSHGWAKADRFSKVDELVTKLAPLRAEREKLEATPFYSKAKELEGSILADLEGRFADMEGGKWTGAVMKIEPPFVFFIQKDRSWDEKAQARNRSRTLLDLQDIIREEFKGELDLSPVEVPVPVLLFRNHKMYLKYSGSDASVLAHFEPGTGRLAVHDDCKHTTIMHEGTHQLMWFWSKRGNPAALLGASDRSYWFQEGVAEWYSGASKDRSTDPPTFEIGRMQPGRLTNLRTVRPKLLLNLKELLQCRYKHRAKLKRQGRTGALYAQGWFFIYFMNHFNVDSEGVVHPRAKGKYADKWHEYVKAELQGKTGLKLFMDVMGVDMEGLKKMREEHWRFVDWCASKTGLKAIKDREIIPWNEQVNKRGEKVGEPKDDILPPFNPKTAPPWDRDSIGNTQSK